jgi:hypothetical protein
MLRKSVQNHDNNDIYRLSTKPVDKSVHGRGHSTVPTAPLRAPQRLGEILTNLK